MKLKDLLLGRKVMTNLDSILEIRGITLPTKVCLVKAMVFPVVMYGCESWTVKKAERWRIDAFEQWCWRRLLRVPWTARRSNQSILKEISPECSLEGLMLKLKLQYFGHLFWRADSLEKTLMLERLKAEEEGEDRGWDGWMASLTQWTWIWVNSRNWWWTGRPCMLRSMGLQRVRDNWGTELNWTDVFRNRFYYLNHWHLLISSSWLTKNLLWNECLMVLNFSFIWNLYIDLLPLLLWSSLWDLSEMLPPGLQSSFCPK